MDLIWVRREESAQVGGRIGMVVDGGGGLLVATCDLRSLRPQISSGRRRSGSSLLFFADFGTLLPLCASRPLLIRARRRLIGAK